MTHMKDTYKGFPASHHILLLRHRKKRDKINISYEKQRAININEITDNDQCCSTRIMYSGCNDTVLNDTKQV